MPEKEEKHEKEDETRISDETSESIRQKSKFKMKSTGKPKDTKKKPKKARPTKKLVKREARKTSPTLKDPNKTEVSPKATSITPPSKKLKDVSVTYKALIKLLGHGLRFSNPRIPRDEWVECMGFLVGNIEDDLVEIRDAIPMTHGNIVEVEFQKEHYSKADEINLELTDDNWIVGWYHTHPGHGLFLSSVDKINQSGYQTLNDKAIALVFDPSKLNDDTAFDNFIKFFRLTDPSQREDSEFVEIKNVEFKTSPREISSAILDFTSLNTINYPLVMEYKEEYQRTPLETEKGAEEFQHLVSLIEEISEDVKALREDFDAHESGTPKPLKHLEKKIDEIEPSEAYQCAFCGYDLICEGDTHCANCGKPL